MDLMAEAARVGEEGAPAALATVIRTAGSTPRHPGAKMIVRGDGTLVGTIGGGRIELEVIAAAVAVARGAPATRVTKHLVRDLAMCCGGEMELWIEPLDAARGKALGEAARRRAGRRTCVLVTALDGVGGGGKDVLSEGDGGAAGRAAWIDGDRFFEVVAPTDRLILFGAGHIAHAIAPLAERIGFEIVVCDEDERFATPERFPGARILGTFDERDVEKELGPLGGGDYGLIVTRDHAVDQAILERLLPRAELAYLGLIGSRGKLGRFRKRLEAKGIGDEAAWARLRSPVGMDIGAETPEEIAVSVVAELIQVRRRGGAR
jgi:xanthine dehydrogenase accessory factor